MNEQIKKMAKEICLATQNTNYSCKSMCKKQGSCAYCIVMAESLYNANCRKKSENTVELPCKVGATIYLPWEFDGVRSIAGLTVTHIIFDTEHNYVKTDFKTDDEAYYDKYKCGSYEFEDFGKIVFLDKDEAEKALLKMKGGA